MSLQDWGVIITILMVVINSTLFILLPNANPNIFACLAELNPSLTTFAGSKGIVGTCQIEIQQPPAIVGATTPSGLPNEIITAITNTVGSVVGTIGYIFNLLGIIAFLLFNIVFLGWISIYNILFLSIPEVGSIFFVIGIAITIIQLFTLALVIKDFVFGLRGT